MNWKQFLISLMHEGRWYLAAFGIGYHLPEPPWMRALKSFFRNKPKAGFEPKEEG